MHTRTEAERAEKEGDWKKAEEHWRACGYHEHADACNRIHKAIEKGNKFRALFEERLKEAGLEATSQPILAHMKIISEAHRETFKDGV